MRISVPQALIDEIARCIDERGEVLDSASDALARIRRELREAHSRLMERLQRIVTASGQRALSAGSHRHPTSGPLRDPAAR